MSTRCVRARGLAVVLLAAGLGCVPYYPVDRVYPHPFDPHRDALAYANELVWSYPDADPEVAAASSLPAAGGSRYAHHCFAMVRAARAFFRFARFDPSRPPANAATYRRLVKAVIDAPADRPEQPKIAIPGYADLRAFSAAWAPLLKDATGGAWRSYVQRANWRMILPFSRGEQERTAEQLVASLGRDRPPIVHVVRLLPPAINHAVLLYGVEAHGRRLRFHLYDPNDPGASRWLVFDRTRRRFVYPHTEYFPGGPVDVYEVYRGWIY